jgi:hypothetical protein
MHADEAGRAGDEDFHFTAANLCRATRLEENCAQPFAALGMKIF